MAISSAESDDKRHHRECDGGPECEHRVFCLTGAGWLRDQYTRHFRQKAGIWWTILAADFRSRAPLLPAKAGIADATFGQCPPN